MSSDQKDGKGEQSEGQVSELSMANEDPKEVSLEEPAVGEPAGGTGDPEGGTRDHQ